MLDVEHLINEVKRRPVLWDISHPEYNHRQPKRTAWEEVAYNMFPDSLEWSNYDKFGKVEDSPLNLSCPYSWIKQKKHLKDLQKKWKHLRDNYVRELKYERKVEKGMATAKRKKYMYFHLLDFIVLKKKDKNKSCSDSSSSELDDSRDQYMEDGPNSASPSMKCSALLTHDYVASQDSQIDSTPTRATLQGFEPEQFEGYNDNLSIKNKKELPSSSVATPPTSSHHTLLENDDDKMFLMSLLPYFKKLNEEKKLQARIGVENLLLTLLYNK